MKDAPDHDVVTEAASAARYRQRRLLLLVALLAATVVPIVSLGAWWLWPLLVVPAVLAAPLAGSTGLIATLLTASIALASASGGDVASTELVTGFMAILIVSALGAAYAASGQRQIHRLSVSAGDDRPLLAPRDVFDLIADRDCRRAAEIGSPVSVAVVAMPGVDSLGRRHGSDTLRQLLASSSAAVMRATSGSDLVAEIGSGRYVALVAGTADAADDVARRMARALADVAVVDPEGAGVTAGEVKIGVAEWAVGDRDLDVLIERASAAMHGDPQGAGSSRPADDGATAQFSVPAVADAA